MHPRKRFVVELPSHHLVLGERTLIMGILNVTPDSFSDGGRHYRYRDAISRGLQLEDEGADIIDVGGESTRPPFLSSLPADEEARRVVPVIEKLKRRVRIPLSVDTFKASVARLSISVGAEVINDISALRLDPDMAEVAASSGGALILMHSRGGPGTMHHMPMTADCLRTVIQSLKRSIKKALAAGVRKSRLIIDPGLGFSKTADESINLLKNLPSLSRLNLPIAIGASRKSFLGKLLAAPVEDRLLGSVGSAAVASLQGAHIIRVHDVRATLQVLRVCDAVRFGSLPKEKR